MMESSVNGSAPVVALKAEGSTSNVSLGTGGSMASLRAISSTALSSVVSALAGSGSGGGGGGANSQVHVENLRNQATSLWSSARSWNDFFNTRKFTPAANVGEVQQRLVDNLQHFTSNYIIIFVALSALGVLVHPLSFVCVIVIAVLYLYLFMSSATTVMFGQVVPPNAKRAGFFVFSVFLLYMTNAVTIISSWLFFSLAISIVHAGARVSIKEPDFESEV